MKRIAIIVVLVLSFFVSSAYAQPTADEKKVAKVALGYLVKKIQSEYGVNQKEQEVHAQFIELVQKIEKKQHVQIVQTSADENVFNVAQISKSFNHNLIIMVVVVILLTLTFKKYNFRRAIAMLTCITFLSSCAAGTINIVNLRGGKVEQLGGKTKMFVEYKILHKEGGIVEERDIIKDDVNYIKKGEAVVSKITVLNPKGVKFKVDVYYGSDIVINLTDTNDQKWMKDYVHMHTGKICITLTTKDEKYSSEVVIFKRVPKKALQPPKGLKIKLKTKNQKPRKPFKKVKLKALQRRTEPTKLKIMYEQDPKKFQVFSLEQNAVRFKGERDVRVRLKNGLIELYHGYSFVNLNKVDKVRFIQIGKVMASNFYVMGSAIV